MPSQTQLLLSSRKSGSVNLVDIGIRRKIRSSSKKIKNPSPTEEDMDRVANDYIEEDDLDNIYNKKSALDAVRTLDSDDNLSNFLDAVGRRNFADKLLENYGKNNLKKLLTEDITLKSGKTFKGYKANTRVYLRETKAGLRAFRFKNNTFAKIPKGLFK